MYGGGDPDWLFELPREKRVRVIAYMTARRDPAVLGASATLQASDILGIIKQILRAFKKGGGGGEKDLVADLLGQL